jgi:hypothetical protein
MEKWLENASNVSKKTKIKKDRIIEQICRECMRREGGGFEGFAKIF